MYINFISMEKPTNLFIYFLYVDEQAYYCKQLFYTTYFIKHEAYDVRLLLLH